jgi:hypothetical protein
VSRFPAWLFLLAPIALAVAACGPSFQVVYEGDVRFEHCYAMDQTEATADAKKECWRQWLKGYTYGQSRDRVEFAASRANALSVAPAQPEETPGHVIAAAPMPTNAFAPPPNMAASAEATATEAPPPDAGAPRPRTPGADCADACEGRWTSCRSGCRDATCANCDRAYLGCMPACFRDERDAPMSRQPLRSVR